MASAVGVQLVASNSWTFAAGGPVGGLIGIGVMVGAALLDAQIMKSLQDDPEPFKDDTLRDIPTASVRTSAPRVFALGGQVRAPAHPIWIGEKRVIEQSIGGGKQGPTGVSREVRANCAYALNDRQIRKVERLHANGKLLYDNSPNLVRVTTTAMSASDVGNSTLRITMASAAEPDLSEYFRVGDFVQLENWLTNNSTGCVTFIHQPGDRRFFRVSAVTGHTFSQPSYLEAVWVSQQAYTGTFNLTAGTAATPGSVVRVDDAIVLHGPASTSGAPRGYAANDGSWQVETVDLGSSTDISPRCDVSKQFYDVVKQRFVAPRSYFWAQDPTAASSWDLKYIERWADRGTYWRATFTAENAWWLTPNLAANNCSAFVIGNQPVAPDVLQNVVLHQGQDNQAIDAIIDDEISGGAGTAVPFRGQAYAVLDNLELSRFGSQLPICEAVISIDQTMTWGEAIQVLCERSELYEVNTSRVPNDPFLGYFVSGTVSGLQALQPLVIAKQLATQEKDGTLHWFPIDQADVVQIENGAQFSDLGTYAGSDTPNRSDKISRSQVDPAALPTSVTVRFQDYDNALVDGSQHFGLRQPTEFPSENQQTIDLSRVVMSRKQARNLAATTVRRAWTNAQSVELSLPMSYMDIAENDLITLTDDDGNDITARVIRREIGQNYLVNVVAVYERVGLEVTGSPVQGPSATIPPALSVPNQVDHVVLDMPSMLDSTMHLPGVYVGVRPRDPSNRWSGASLWSSQDGGATWQRQAVLTQLAAFGTSVTSLASTANVAETHGSSTVTWDTTSTVQVEIPSWSSFGPPSTQSQATIEASWQSRLNWFQIGDEIIAAATITPQGNDVYELSDLLRGLRGTTASAGTTKAAGQQVVELFGHDLNMHFVAAAPGAQLLWRIVPGGRPLEDADDISLTVQARNAKPMPVRDLARNVKPSNDVWFTCTHWTRSMLPIAQVGPYVLDETVEAYELRIYDSTNTTLTRTKTISAEGTGSPTLRAGWYLPYTVAEQTADGYTPGVSSIWCEIEQVGDHGRGPAARIQV
jgi:hypothetical protein